MEQFPVGMELFSAADEDQWGVISQTIDTSDYYVLIIGRRYGSIIPDGFPDAGISYTEKEFNYAVSKGISILAFLMEEETANSISSGETPDKHTKLYEFKEKVKLDRYVKFFKNPDQLATYLSQSIHKAIKRNNRPGWIRTTEFDIEESYARILQLTERIHTLEALNADLKIENDRKPELLITYRRDPEAEDENGNPISNELEIKDGIIIFKVKPVYMEDAKNGVSYKNTWGEKISVAREDVRLLRHLFQNGFSLLFHIVNSGTSRATGVRIHMDISDGMLVLSNREIDEYMKQPMINCSDEEYDGKMRTLFAPKDAKSVVDEDTFISVDELLVNEDIANLLDSGELDVSAGEIKLEFNEIRHKDSQFYRGAYFYPTKPGRFEIKCSIMCNELVEAVNQIIVVNVE